MKTNFTGSNYQDSKPMEVIKPEMELMEWYRTVKETPLRDDGSY
jgi:hypothetical protein